MGQPGLCSVERARGPHLADSLAKAREPAPLLARNTCRDGPGRRRGRLRRYLVVANQTLSADQLHRKVLASLAAGPCTFHVVVPATPPSQHLTWSEGEAFAIAHGRLDAALAWFGQLGAEVDGEVGDANPLLAISDALREGEFDEIVLSTLPAGLSRWLQMDLPSRASAAFDLPVSHIISEPERHRVR
jgi:hypothetical protein